MAWTDEFVADLLNMSELGLFQKYDNKIPSSTKVIEVVNAIKQLSAERKLVQKDWDGSSDIVFNLVSTGNGYEVFQTERGGKHWVTRHDSIDAAIFDKIDRIFNALMHSAPDSKINA